MSISTDSLLDHAGSDYDDLPADVRQMVDEAESDLGRVGISVKADLAATEEADTLVTEPAPAAAAPATDTPPSSFSSRGKARNYASTHGLKVIDNGAGSVTRWTVESKGTVVPKAKAKKAALAPAATSTARPAGKKAVAIEVYAELEASGTLKRSNFLREMAERTGLEEKGASSYFYRIKGGKW